MSVLVATAYRRRPSASNCLVAMNAGRILAAGSPAEIKALTGQETLEESFIALLPEAARAGRTRAPHPAAAGCATMTRSSSPATSPAGSASFLAVDGVNFTIERGEIFGFLGSNGCGKTTTMKMLTGLLPPSAGTALLFGQPIDGSDMRSRAAASATCRSPSRSTPS